MDQAMAKIISDVDLDMSTIEGRLRWAVFIMGLLDYTGKKALPVMPESLNGYGSIDVKRIMQRSKPTDDDRRVIQAHAKWRREMLTAEGINEVNLRSGLRAIQIFDEAMASDLDEKEKDSIPTKRETVVFLLRNAFDVQSEEIEEALLDIWAYSRHKCRDMVAFNHWWRDPLRWD